MSEFHELVKEAPNFNAMERGELVTYAYAMFAAGTKADSENAKLRKENDTLCHRIDELCMENAELEARNANQKKLLETYQEELIGWHEVARLVQSKLDEFGVIIDGS